MKALPILILATALAVTAGCANDDVGDPASAAPAASASGTAGFGAGPTTPPPATASPAPERTSTSPEPEREREPEPKTTSRSPKAEIPEWADVVKKCPYDGQKVEIQNITQADVTKDGVADTLVTRGCEASTSYWASTIEVFDGAAEPERPRRIATLLEDVAKMDQPVVSEVSVSRGIVGVKAWGTSEKGTKACPDLVLFYRYQQTGDGFRRIWRDVGTTTGCEP